MSMPGKNYNIFFKINYPDVAPCVAEPVLFCRSRSRCEGPAPAPPYIKQKKF